MERVFPGDKKWSLVGCGLSHKALSGLLWEVIEMVYKFNICAVRGYSLLLLNINSISTAEVHINLF